MFFLEELPSDSILESFAKMYEEMNPKSVKAFLHLLKIGSKALNGYEAILKKHDLSTGRFLVLVVLKRDEKNPLKPSEIAKKLGVSRPTVTKLIKGLESSGHIGRVINDAGDMREFLIKITKLGEQKIDEIMPIYYQGINRFMKDFTDDEKELLTTLLLKIENNLV